MKKTFVALMMALGLVSVASADGTGDVVVKKFKVGKETIKHEMELSYTVEYDAKERVSRVSEAAGYEASYAYDDKDNIVEALDSLGNWTKVEYDENGNKLKEVNFTHEWDDDEGHESVTVYEYNDKNLLVREKSDVLETWYEYDADGNCILEKDDLGGVIATKYKDGLAVEKSYKAEANEAFSTYDYDEKGNLIHYTYSEEDWLYEEWYEFDADGNVVFQNDTMGNEVVYAYDKYGNVYYVRDIDGNCEYYENKYKRGKLIKTTVYFWEDEVKG